MPSPPLGSISPCSYQMCAIYLLYVLKNFIILHDTNFFLTMECIKLLSSICYFQDSNMPTNQDIGSSVLPCTLAATMATGAWINSCHGYTVPNWMSCDFAMFQLFSYPSEPNPECLVCKNAPRSENYHVHNFFIFILRECKLNLYNFLVKVINYYTIMRSPRMLIGDFQLIVCALNIQIAKFKYQPKAISPTIMLAEVMLVHVLVCQYKYRIAGSFEGETFIVKIFAGGSQTTSVYSLKNFPAIYTVSNCM